MSHEEKVEHYLRSLFRSSYRVHELIAQIGKRSKTLNEISMNAAIAAGHTGTQSRVFSEIAKQIGIAANLFTDACEQIRESTGRMSGETLECLNHQAQRGKFLLAVPLLEEGRTRRDVSHTADQLSAAILERLSSTQGSLATLKPMRERLQLLAQRTWSIVVGIRVSAGMAEGGDQGFFLSIAEALETTTNELGGLVDTVESVLTEIDSRLREGAIRVKGHSNAA